MFKVNIITFEAFKVSMTTFQVDFLADPVRV